MNENSNPNVSNILKWDKIHAVLLLFSIFLTFWTASLWPLIVLPSASFLYYTIQFIPRFEGASFPFGWSNFVTIVRLVILIVLYANVSIIDFWLIASILLFILVLDGIDGYLARKLNQESAFGKYLDMESDAYYVCLVSAHLFLTDLMPIWILLVGGSRYINVLLEELFLKRKSLDGRFPFAVGIALFLFFSLITPYFMAKNLYFPLLTVSSCLVMISFCYVFILNLRS